MITLGFVKCAPSGSRFAGKTGIRNDFLFSGGNSPDQPMFFMSSLLGADLREKYRYFLEKDIVPIIPLSKNSKPVSPHLPGNEKCRLDEDGTPLCPAGDRMRRHQYDKKQKKHVFCCPAKRGTHRKGKAIYVFRENECPLKKDCEPKSSRGPFVYIKSRHDPRLFPPLPRESRQFNRIYKQRSASERINFINDSYRLDKTCRNADYGLIRLTLANIAHHAVVRYRKAKESGDDFNLSAFMASGVIPEAEPAPG